MSQQTLTPYIVSPDAAAATEFYKQAFGAQELARHLAPDSKRLLHVHLRILDSDFMLSDDFCDKMGGKPETPSALGGCPVTFHLQVNDANSVWEQATAAGAKVIMPLQDQFWGDRYGQVMDPHGYKWSIGQKIRQMTPEEVAAGAKATF